MTDLMVASKRIGRREIAAIVREELNKADIDIELTDAEVDRVCLRVKADVLNSLPPLADAQRETEPSAELIGQILERIEGRLHPSFTIRHEANGSLREIRGKAHPKFARALRLAAARRNILLIGPAGCGKTHLAEQLAEALGLEFRFISCSAGMSEGQLLGRLVPTGDAGKFEYLRSDFVKSYEEGGVFLFDEIDAADSNTLLVINAALANSQMAVPNRPEKPIATKHPDFVCIAAANTFGTGADRQYVGRNQLDESTLDRFRIGQIEMDYDPEIEAALCPDDALRSRLLSIRNKVRDSKIRRLVSMRFLRDAYVMLQAGDTIEDIEQSLFAGWTRDELNKVQ